MARPHSACSTIVLFIAALLLGGAPAACGGSVIVDDEPDEDGDTGGDTGGDTHTGPGATTGPTEALTDHESNCGIVCDALLALQCSDNVACVSDCIQSFVDAGSCAGMLAEYVACFADHINNLSCSVFPYQCDGSYSAFATCKLG